MKLVMKLFTANLNATVCFSYDGVMEASNKILVPVTKSTTSGFAKESVVLPLWEFLRSRF